MEVAYQNRLSEVTSNSPNRNTMMGVLSPEAVRIEQTPSTISPDAEAHSILRITLSGPALIFTILTLIVSIHLFHPSLMATVIALAPVPYIIRNDYRAFLSLGPGGTPSTFAGYIKITYLRFFALSDPFSPPPILGTICPATGCFQSAPSKLPYRAGPRPLIAGIAPQRQIDQWGCPNMYLAFRAALNHGAERYPDLLRTDVSCFERNGLALFALNPLNMTCRGEIVHIHHTDHSMHLNLHPLDAKVVLDNGWGQRHPLAKGGRYRKYVPREFVMVYAPRNIEELEVVLQIVEAAAWWVMGQRVHLRVPEKTIDGGFR